MAGYVGYAETGMQYGNRHRPLAGDVFFESGIWTALQGKKSDVKHVIDKIPNPDRTAKRDLRHQFQKPPNEPSS